MRVLTAEFDKHDAAICAIAKLSRYTRDFTSHRFFRDSIRDTYAKGEVGAAVEGRRVVGFVYVKHLVRSPMSVVHYMAVAPEAKQRGIGRKLLDWALATSPHGYVELSCEHTNAEGGVFYAHCGFTAIRVGAYGKAPRARPYTRFARRA